jgi:hypothetical protein
MEFKISIIMLLTSFSLAYTARNETIINRIRRAECSSGSSQKAATAAEKGNHFRIFKIFIILILKIY